ncbi:SMC-Scp complex subunit ScpB [Arcanobacterium hippocoleae]|uniref:Segregation and condensation protein B n=1 Tax=Arcanobacterium hippocoleae TaxID=149017 RepID=A0ABU1T0F2_9ACTO|nr:SMC-Scp complex subunit ScpB [Arcanobacterium hippocoleae]MDR6938786.1 segregation and condensation protein B [Arcanobacterium hippocoleae]
MQNNGSQILANNAEAQFAKGALEAILMVAADPVSVDDLSKALDLRAGIVDQLLRELAAQYADSEFPRGFQLREVGGGWRFYSHPHYADIVRGFVTAGQKQQLSVQALETLAIIAYRQPITRAQISAIRGVDVDGVVRTLQIRGLVEQVGVTQDTGASLYQTTAYFMERMGLNSLDEMPDLAPYLPDNEILEEIEKEIK